MKGLRPWSCCLAAAAEPAPAAVCASGSAAPDAAGTVHMCKLAHKHNTVKHLKLNQTVADHLLLS